MSRDRPGLRAVNRDYARDGDLIVVHTPDRLGGTVRDTLNSANTANGAPINTRALLPITSQPRAQRLTPQP